MSKAPHKHTIAAFKNYVPRWLRIVLFIVFALVFQFSNTAYLSLTGTITGANQILKEDLNFLFQMTAVGICFVYPLLFRFKLRFTSQQIIIGSSLVAMAMMGLIFITDSVPVLAAASFVLGAAKMLGTFEALVSIQLIITPNKDYGVFFSVALGLVLLSGQVSGIWATFLNYDYDWTVIYKIMIAANAVMILLVQLLLQPIRVAKKLPLYGIDWLGYFLWSSFFSCLTYVFCYGQVLDWFHSDKILFSLWLSVVFGILTLWRMFRVRRPYLKSRIFTIGNVNVSIMIMLLMQPFLSASGNVLGPFTSGVLHLDDLGNSALNWWIALGITAGALFSYYWFLKIEGSFKLFFIVAFSSVSLYYGLLYFDLSTYADSSVLPIPYFLRGFGNILLFVGVGKYITRNVGLDVFTQVLCYLAMARNSLGSLIPSALIGYVEYWRTLDFNNKLGSKIDSFNSSASIFYQTAYRKALSNGNNTNDAAISAGKEIFGKVNQQAVLLAGKEIFGLMTFFGIVVILILLTIHFGRPFISKIPSWYKLRSILYVTNTEDNSFNNIEIKNSDFPSVNESYENPTQEVI
jgi:hypothetical protein